MGLSAHGGDKHDKQQERPGGDFPVHIPVSDLFCFHCVQLVSGSGSGRFPAENLFDVINGLVL